MRVYFRCFAALNLLVSLKVSLITGVALFLAALVLPQIVRADNVINFYEHNSAKTTFAEEAVPTATPELGFAPARVALKDSNDLNPLNATQSNAADTFQVKYKADNASNNSTDTDLTKNTVTRTMTREEIVQAFGTPDGDLPVNGMDNAPQPFRAVQRALELGDDQLAYEYAKQYVKYLRKVGDRTEQIGKLVSQVMNNEKAQAAQSKEVDGKEVDSDFDRLTDMALKAMHPVKDSEHGGAAYER